jgi:hypothetical protein
LARKDPETFLKYVDYVSWYRQRKEIEQSIEPHPAAAARTADKAGQVEGILSDGEHAELLVYPVDEEKDIYIGMLVLVCHIATHLAT